MNRGILFTAISAILYGSIGFFGIKMKSLGMSVMDLCFWRFLISAAFLLPFLRSFLNETVKLKHLILAFILGSLFYASSAYYFFAATSHLGTGLSMVIFFTYPIYVVLISSCITRTYPNRTTWAALFLITFGCFLIASEKDMNFDAIGLVFASVSALTYGIYVAFSKGMTRTLSPLLGTFIVCLGSTFSFYLMIPALQGPITLPTSTEMWVYIFLFAAFGTILPVLFLLLGMRYISASKAAILSVLEPVTVLAVAYLVLGEELSVRQILGSSIIVSSAVLISFKKE